MHAWLTYVYVDRPSVGLSNVEVSFNRVFTWIGVILK